MAGQKVTFYNEVSIERNSSSADIKIPGNASSLSPNGIYFTPNTDTLHNDAAPHIVQGQYIYTLGSKVLEDNKTDAITIVQGDTDMSNTHFETNTAALVVTNIESDEFNKTLTVTKKPIDISPLTKTVENFAKSLTSTNSEIQINGNTLRLYWDNGKLVLGNTTILPNNITISTTSHRLSTSSLEIAVISAETTINSITISNNIDNYLSTEKNGKTATIKLTSTGTGWSSDEKNSTKTFNISVNAKEENNISSASKSFNLTIEKIASPFEISVSDWNLSNGKEKEINVSNTKGDVVYSINNISGKYKNGNFQIQGNKITCSDIYNTDNVTITADVTDNTQSTDIYYQTKKSKSFTCRNAGKWKVNFSVDNSIIAAPEGQYLASVSFPQNPSDKTDGTYNYTFAGWYTAVNGGTKYSSLSFADDRLTWSNHTISLFAHWTKTEIPVETKYYWYVGQENPAEMTSISPIVTDNTSPGWRLIGTSIPTYSVSNMLWNESKGIIVTGASLAKQYVAIPAKSSACPRDGFGADASTVDIYTKLNNVTINGVEYKVYETVGKSKKYGLDTY